MSEIASKGKKGRGGGGGGARSVAFDEDGNMIEDESAMVGLKVSLVFGLLLYYFCLG